MLKKADEVSNEPSAVPEVRVNTAPTESNVNLHDKYWEVVAERGGKDLATSPNLPEWVKQRIRERFNLAPVAIDDTVLAQYIEGGASELAIAIVGGDLPKIKSLVASGVNIENVLVLEKGKNLAVKEDLYQPALLLAAEQFIHGATANRESIVKYFLETGAKVAPLDYRDERLNMYDKSGSLAKIIPPYRDGIKTASNPKANNVAPTVTSSLLDGDSYEGEYKDGKMHGHGTYRWKDGRQFVGEWLQGKTQTGIYMMPNGYTYIGSTSGLDPQSFSLNNIKGTGELRFPDGKRYVHYFGYADQAGALIDARGGAIMGMLDLYSVLPDFEELTIAELQNFNVDYAFIEQYNVASIKQFNEFQFQWVREKQDTRVVDQESALDQLEIERCAKEKKRQLKKLKYIAEIANELECDVTNNDDAENLQEFLTSLSSEYSVNEQNTGDTGYWIKRLRECINEISYDLDDEIKPWINRGDTPDKTCKDSESIAFIQGIFDARDDYVSYTQTELRNAADYANQRQRGAYAQMRSNDDAHIARMNADFQRWSNDLRASSQRSLDQIGDVSNRTHQAMNEMQGPKPGGSNSVNPQNVEARYKADKAIRDQEKAIQKQKEDEEKREREREIEREIAQYKLEEKWRQEDAERRIRQAAIDSEADREAECMIVLANDPNACGCSEYGPKRSATFCNK